MLQTAFGVGTRSWYKLGGDTGRVFGIWPGKFLGPSRPWTSRPHLDERPILIYLLLGSVLHALKSLEHPRWEDFEYEQSDKGKNRLHWLGDGQTSDEKVESGDSEFSSRVWPLRKRYPQTI